MFQTKGALIKLEIKDIYRRSGVVAHVSHLYTSCMRKSDVYNELFITEDVSVCY